MFRNDRAIPTLNRCVNIDACTEYFYPILSLCSNSPIVALECLVDEAIFLANIYIYTHVSGSESFLFDARKGKTNIANKTSRAILIRCQYFHSFLPRKERIREGIASSRLETLHSRERFGLIGTGLILLRVGGNSRRDATSMLEILVANG